LSHLGTGFPNMQVALMLSDDGWNLTMYNFFWYIQRHASWVWIFAY